MIYRGYYVSACGYEFYLLVFNSISHEWVAGDGHQLAAEDQQKHPSLSFATKARIISRETKKHENNYFSNTHEQFSWPSCKCWVTQKLRNSSVVHHRTKSPFGAKICVNISFQLLLYIMTVKSQEDKQFCNLNFSDVMWKPGILRSQVTHLIWLPYQCHLEVFWVGKGKQINTPLIFFASITYNLSCVLCYCLMYKSYKPGSNFR